MKVIARVKINGVPPGEVVEVDDDKARRLIARRWAVGLVEPPADDEVDDDDL